MFLPGVRTGCYTINIVINIIEYIKGRERAYYARKTMKASNVEQQIVSFCRALGDENRIKIILLLAEREMCVCEIIEMLDLSQPAVSHHLKILKHAGLVQDKRGGRWIFYSLDLDFLSEIKRMLQEKMWTPLEALEKTGIPPSPARKDGTICQGYESTV